MSILDEQDQITAELRKHLEAFGAAQASEREAVVNYSIELRRSVSGKPHDLQKARANTFAAREALDMATSNLYDFMHDLGEREARERP